MQGLYGSLWVDRWRTGETVERAGRTFDRGLLLAKATWAEELAGFSDMPDRISKALEACRHRNMPPTLPEFLDLCRQQHGDAPKALPAPRLSADEVAPRIAELARKVAKPQIGDTGWARGEPPFVRGPWESAIIELAEKGDPRFIAILQEHVANGVIRSERARAALGRETADAAAA
ncbi:hypothetical protein U5817_09895 [Aromatoleum evansii]|uniref:Uncharacterized protein n=1 Tax=Aromatoleum evansii TaxID=59406 RepID=A0ABZ1ARB8_AROEV|nr:hypothetical protein U5817_09545 [Aromatoleum evansii]WRL48338.1 hypothetical protein U5817_09895 [Aromatoleum evansii]